MVPFRSKWAAGKAVRAGLAVGGRTSELIRKPTSNAAAGPFSRNPLGRGRLAVFRRCKRQSGSDLDPCESRYGQFARVWKNSQLTCGDVIVIYETVH
jgi:hypothetical protein